VTRKTWKWATWKSIALLVLFLSFDIPFFGANITKFVDGGYVPISAGAIFFIVMINWKRGRQLLRERLEERSVPLPTFVHDLDAKGVARIPGAAIYVTGTNGVRGRPNETARRRTFLVYFAECKKRDVSLRTACRVGQARGHSSRSSGRTCASRHDLKRRPPRCLDLSLRSQGKPWLAIQPSALLLLAATPRMLSGLPLDDAWS
jgi:hypothetical protein